MRRAAQRRSRIKEQPETFGRAASTGAIGPMIKTVDPATQRLIDDWKQRNGQA